jgi:hypothetical protein
MKVVYNTSGSATSSWKEDQVGYKGSLEKKERTPHCKPMCSVDEQVNVTGTPALFYNNTASMGWKGQEVGDTAWLPLAIVGCAIFGFL